MVSQSEILHEGSCLLAILALARAVVSVPQTTGSTAGKYHADNMQISEAFIATARQYSRLNYSIT
jgi:hypothetical protein